MSTQYSLRVKHDGTDYGNFCIYQTYKNQPEDIRSLAWFVKSAHPGTQLKLNWSVDYSFAWSNQGELQASLRPL